MPARAVVPVIVLIIGYTESMTVVVVIFVAVLPVLLSTRANWVGTERLEAARVIRLGRGETLRNLLLPASAIILRVQIAAPLPLIIRLVVAVITQASRLDRQIGLAQAQV